MEELVASVMSDFLGACEAKLCGRPADGGIDIELYFVASDTPIAVQVKRRSDPTSIEAVAGVREFLAAIQLQGISRGVFVTTADHFSEPAQQAAKGAITLDLVKQYDLIDRDQFVEMLRDTSPAANASPWLEHLDYDPWES